MLTIAIMVRCSSKGPALFVQKRIGRNGRLFTIFKFRSMAHGSNLGPCLTQGGDQRVTPLGRWIRKFKLDELPQFVNVLCGDMSLVGPRPKLPLHEPMRNMPYRPGLTGAATLAFRNEEDILKGMRPSELEHFYDVHIKPVKVQIDTDYMKRASFGSDVRLMAATLMACLSPAPTYLSVTRND
jgi:lipopolysaccharide/colanic/teichoic acid biosynthesis glycosyltransferase